MADIVRLEENGVPQYLETVPEAVVGLDKYSRAVILNGNSTVSYGEAITLSEPVINFDYIDVTFSYRGNRVTARYNPMSSMEIRTTGTNLADAEASAAWDMCEAVFTITNGKTLKCTSSKVVNHAGKVTNKDSNMTLVYLMGVNVSK